MRGSKREEKEEGRGFEEEERGGAEGRGSRVVRLRLVKVKGRESLSELVNE